MNALISLARLAEHLAPAATFACIAMLSHGCSKPSTPVPEKGRGSPIAIQLCGLWRCATGHVRNCMLSPASARFPKFAFDDNKDIDEFTCRLLLTLSPVHGVRWPPQASREQEQSISSQGASREAKMTDFLARSEAQNRWQALGWVESKNGMGVPIRKRFEVWCLYRDGVWEPEDYLIRDAYEFELAALKGRDPFGE